MWRKIAVKKDLPEKTRNQILASEALQKIKTLNTFTPRKFDLLGFYESMNK